MEDAPLYEIPPSQSWQVSEEPAWDYGEVEYSRSELAQKFGSEEWFLTYTLNPDGSIESLEESSTYSLSFSTETACVKTFVLVKDRSTGDISTEQTYAATGRWKTDKRLLAILLPDETLEFIVMGIENGIATLMDPDDNILSIFMTEAALLKATKQLMR